MPASSQQYDSTQQQRGFPPGRETEASQKKSPTKICPGIGKWFAMPNAVTDKLGGGRLPRACTNAVFNYLVRLQHDHFGKEFTYGHIPANEWSDGSTHGTATPPVSAAEVAKATGYSTRAAQDELKYMVDMELFARLKVGKIFQYSMRTDRWGTWCPWPRPTDVLKPTPAPPPLPDPIAQPEPEPFRFRLHAGERTVTLPSHATKITLHESCAETFEVAMVFRGGEVVVTVAAKQGEGEAKKSSGIARPTSEETFVNTDSKADTEKKCVPVHSVSPLPVSPPFSAASEPEKEAIADAVQTLKERAPGKTLSYTTSVSSDYSKASVRPMGTAYSFADWEKMLANDPAKRARFDAIKAAIPGKLCKKLHEVPKPLLLVAIDEELGDAPLENLTARIRLRWQGITSLGMLKGLASDVRDAWREGERDAPAATEEDSIEFAVGSYARNKDEAHRAVMRMQYPEDAYQEAFRKIDAEEGNT
jgi:hypothetical protein